MLKNKGIVRNRRLKTYQVFTTEVTDDFLGVHDPDFPLTMKSSDYIKKCWGRYSSYASKLSKSNNALNGYMFETIIKTELFRQKIKPFFDQVNLAFVPNVDYDIVLFGRPNSNEENADNNSNEALELEQGTYHPIVLSLKTSTRERYKQADLEAVVLKNVYRKAENYLLMLSGNESKTLKEKVKSGDVLALDGVIEADTDDMDDLIDRLKRYQFGIPSSVNIVENGNQIN